MLRSAPLAPFSCGPPALRLSKLVHDALVPDCPWGEIQPTCEIVNLMDLDEWATKRETVCDLEHPCGALLSTACAFMADQQADLCAPPDSNDDGPTPAVLDATLQAERLALLQPCQLLRFTGKACPWDDETETCTWTGILCDRYGRVVEL